jgi:hypothetical protein
VTQDLTAEADSCEVPRSEHASLCIGHRCWFTGDKLDAAGGATCVTTTRVKLVGSRFVNESEHQPLPRRHQKFPNTLHGQLRHHHLLFLAMVRINDI